MTLNLLTRPFLGHADSAPAEAARTGGEADQLLTQPPASTGDRVRVSGKFFDIGGRKWYVKGFTYGPFAPRSDRLLLPDPPRLRDDFAQIAQLGANCIRLYHAPPRQLLDLAWDAGLRVFVDIPWEKHRCFFEDWSSQQDARRAVRTAAEQLGDHPALFAISVVNELPADIVRFYGQRKLERFVDELIDSVKQTAPDCLATFANYPSTEYLQPHTPDFTCFNVYLQEQTRLADYLDRLQHLAGARPLVLGEFGLDSLRNGEPAQAERLNEHVECVFNQGLAGSFVFSFTDDWFTGGHQITDWAFGVTRVDRSEKPAAESLKQAWSRVPQVRTTDLPRISVVVCSYNGAATLEECLVSLEQLRYPDYEVILVDDGSTDDTPWLAARFPYIRYIRQTNQGLSAARNVGAQAATGEVVAYTDSDCVADPDWLYYIADGMRRQQVDAIGGPNVPPPSDGWIAKCVAASPGGPSHVMLDDRRAEHVPGCNMAFRRQTLLALGGFDPQFRQAGDDVDICWRLLDAGHAIGYAPAALVWHHRRSTVRAYLRQQRGYGHSEALLMAKHPRRFNRLGASLWNGVIYGEGAVGLPRSESQVYHGRFGMSLFQSIYSSRRYSVAMLFTLLEWHAVAAMLTIAGILAAPLLVAPAVMWSLTFIAIARTVGSTPLPRGARWWCRPLVFVLHLLQPLVRARARYRTRLRTRRLPHCDLAPVAIARTRDGHYDLHWISHHNHGREHLLHALETEAIARGWRGRFDEVWSTWDAWLAGDCWHSVTVTTATEELGWPKRFTRARLEPRLTLFAITVVASLGLLLAVAAFQPQRPWLLIVLGSAMVGLAGRLLLSRRRVVRAVAALVSRSAESAGLKPDADVSAEPEPAPQPSTSDVEDTENTGVVVV
jgi:O-antigen biosynthesis protein